MQNYSKQVLLCINSFLRERGVDQRIIALYHVTPELVQAMAEWHYDQRIPDLILFLEQRLRRDMGKNSVSADEKLLPHLKSDEFKRGDLFTVLSAAELVYSVHRCKGLPVFPSMTDEVCDLLRRKRDTMVAHGNFLRQNMLKSGGCDCARENLKYSERPESVEPMKQSGNRSVESSNVQDAEMTIEAATQEVQEFKMQMYEEYLKPIIEKYYMSYESENEIKYTIARLQRKLDFIVRQAVHQERRNVEAHRCSVEREIARQFDRALQIEKMNLRDEAKWRADEQKVKRQQASSIASSINTRRMNEREMKAERDEERRDKVRQIRQEEISYVNGMRSEAESVAFRAIQRSSQARIVGNVDRRDFSRATGRDVAERLRLYQGAEFLYNDGVYASE